MKKITLIAVVTLCFANLLGNAQTVTTEDETPQILKDYKEDVDFVALMFDELDNAVNIAESMTRWAAIMCPYTTSNLRITAVEKDSLNQHTLKAFKSAYYAFLRLNEEDLEDELNKSLYEAGFKTIADTVAAMTRDCKTFGRYTKTLAEYIDPGIVCTPESADNGRDQNNTRKSNTGVYEREKTTRPNNKGLTETAEGNDSPGISENNYFIPDGCTPEVAAYLRFYGEIYEKSRRCTSMQEYNKLMSDCTPELMRFMQSTEQLNDVTRKALIESSLYYAPRIARHSYQLAGLNIEEDLISYIIGDRSDLNSKFENRPNSSDGKVTIYYELVNIIPKTRKMLYEIAGKSNTLGEFLNNIQASIVQISKAVAKAKQTLLR